MLRSLNRFGLSCLFYVIFFFVSNYLLSHEIQNFLLNFRVEMLSALSHFFVYDLLSLDHKGKAERHLLIHCQY